MLKGSSKTFQAWQEIEAGFKEKSRATLKSLEEAGDREKLREFLNGVHVNAETYEAKKQEFFSLIQQMQQVAQELADLTEHHYGLRLNFLRSYVGNLDRLVREFMPKTFDIDTESVDKLIRAMEQDRRIRAHQRTLEGMPYEDYLQTPAWQERRSQALRDAGNKCQLCYSPKHLNVHHKTYERRGHELPGDLIVLCQDCHAKHHDKIGPNNPSWDF